MMTHLLTSSCSSKRTMAKIVMLWRLKFRKFRPIIKPKRCFENSRCLIKGFQIWKETRRNSMNKIWKTWEIWNQWNRTHHQQITLVRFLQIRQLVKIGWLIHHTRIRSTGSFQRMYETLLTWQRWKVSTLSSSTSSKLSMIKLLYFVIFSTTKYLHFKRHSFRRNKKNWKLHYNNKRSCSKSKWSKWSWSCRRSIRVQTMSTLGLGKRKATHHLRILRSQTVTRTFSKASWIIAQWKREEIQLLKRNFIILSSLES